jgi:ribosomal protein S18 acetylase RimI-like enzyme
MNFHDALIATYCENPCQVLPNALWKTLSQLENWHSSVDVEKDGTTHLEAWDENKLMIYWTRCRSQLPNLNQNPDFALVHQDYLHTFPVSKFAIRTPYFRLIHRADEIEQRVSLPARFSFVDVKIRQQVEQVSSLIGQCYPDLHPSVESIMGWLEHPTFEPSLWVWVMDTEKRIPVGLGIAEMDKTILEGSLEWIQVLPSYRGLGLGKSIVLELLSRLGKRVKFTTVAGQVDNVTRPETLYRSCGFKGNDVWWLFCN